MIQLDNRMGFSTHEPFWDASWLSKYPEEDERIWFGSFFRLQVQSLIFVDSGKSYAKFFDAFFKFDAILSGTVVNDVSSKDVDIVKSAIESLLDKQAVSDKKLDVFTVDSFFAYALNKTCILLTLGEINCTDNKSFIDLVLHPVHFQSVDNISKDFTNLPQPILFELFGNLEQITINTIYSFFAFSPLSLLSILNGVKLPDSFRTIMIEGINKAFDEGVKAKYAASNFKVEVVDEDNVLISV